jgi:hypothetical protein
MRRFLGLQRAVTDLIGPLSHHLVFTLKRLQADGEKQFAQDRQRLEKARFAQLRLAELRDLQASHGV